MKITQCLSFDAIVYELKLQFVNKIHATSGKIIDPDHVRVTWDFNSVTCIINNVELSCDYK